MGLKTINETRNSSQYPELKWNTDLYNIALKQSKLFSKGRSNIEKTLSERAESVPFFYRGYGEN